jgi:hypothetical protein
MNVLWGHEPSSEKGHKNGPRCLFLLVNNRETNEICESVLTLTFFFFACLAYFAVAFPRAGNGARNQ